MHKELSLRAFWYLIPLALLIYLIIDGYCSRRIPKVGYNWLSHNEDTEWDRDGHPWKYWLVMVFYCVAALRVAFLLVDQLSS